MPEFLQQECAALPTGPPTHVKTPPSFCGHRELTPVRRRSFSSCWLRCESPDTVSAVEPGVCATPRGPAYDRARQALLERVLATPCTPEAKLFIVPDVPPAAPNSMLKNVHGEIDEAVLKRDESLLSLALQQGHQGMPGHVLFKAVQHQHLPALEFLLERGLNPDEHCCGRRPLHLAIQSCMAEGDVGYRMAELLLRKGARPVVHLGDDPLQPSSLHSAAARFCSPATSLLLKYGADPNEADARGDTPLHLACRLAPPHRSQPIYEMEFATSSLQNETLVETTVSLLLRHGACPVQGDAAGLPPAIFIARNNWQLKKLLAKSEQWWSRRALLLVCSHFVTDHAFVDAHSALSTCLGLPDIFRTIVEFL